MRVKKKKKNRILNYQNRIIISYMYINNFKHFFFIFGKKFLKEIMDTRNDYLVENMMKNKKIIDIIVKFC
jgi:hypothetical protein